MVDSVEFDCKISEFRIDYETATVCSEKVLKSVETSGTLGRQLENNLI